MFRIIDGNFLPFLMETENGILSKKILVWGNFHFRQKFLDRNISVMELNMDFCEFPNPGFMLESYISGREDDGFKIHTLRIQDFLIY